MRFVRLIVDGSALGNPGFGGWACISWRASSGKPVLNRELWIELESAAAPHEVSWKWIPGREAEEPDHNRADSLARQAAMAGAA